MNCLQVCSKKNFKKHKTNDNILNQDRNLLQPMMDLFITSLQQHEILSHYSISPMNHIFQSNLAINQIWKLKKFNHPSQFLATSQNPLEKSGKFPKKNFFLPKKSISTPHTLKLAAGQCKSCFFSLVLMVHFAWSF